MRIKSIFLFSILKKSQPILPFLFSFIFSAPAFAQAGENPVGSGLMWLIDQMYGPVGIGLATLAIMVVGLLCLGHICEWKRLVQTLIGIAMVFGAGALVQLIHDAVTR